MAGHSFSVEDRKRLTADGIRHVGTFTDKEIQAETTIGHMVLRGVGLHIVELNLEIGRLVVDGRLDSVIYMEEKKTSARGFWERLSR